ncbi:hypothetical protein ACXYMO_05525 [Arenibacterium sp. CAU 1754]
MFAVEIIIHAFKALFDDVWATIRLTGIPFLIGVALLVGIAVFVLGIPFENVIRLRLNIERFDGSFFTAFFLGFPVVLFTLCWAGVGWHRFVLLDERPKTVFPPIRATLTLAYVRASIRLLLLALLLLMLPVGVLIGLAVSIEFNEGLGVLLLIMSVVALAAVVLRFALVLPAVALDAPFGSHAAWTATAGHFWTFATLVFAGGLIDYLSDHMISPGVFGFALMVLVNWFHLAMNLSILTTLYWILAEGRALNGHVVAQGTDHPE